MITIPEKIETFFAPAERKSKTMVVKHSQIVQQSPVFQAIMDSMDGYLMILNAQRQVLAANRKMIEDLQIKEISCLLGSRPGEILGCIHAAEGPNGCGTAKACATCGAVISILSSQKKDMPVTEECLATVRHKSDTTSLEFRVRSTPVHLDGEIYTVLLFHDISGDKRREVLETTFFHDIMNTLGGLIGWGSLLESIASLDPREATTRMLCLSRRLKQEIDEHRRLLHAENNTLEIEPKTITVTEILDALQSVFEMHEVSKDKHIKITPISEKEKITTDIGLLERILINMTKNALEAISKGKTVEISYMLKNGNPVFSVHNPGVIPEDISNRIFKRSFSTKKQKGRGIGTYSMKLFGERYLKGKVSFESSESKGTVFHIQLPTNTERK